MILHQMLSDSMSYTTSCPPSSLKINQGLGYAELSPGISRYQSPSNDLSLCLKINALHLVAHQLNTVDMIRGTPPNSPYTKRPFWSDCVSRCTENLQSDMLTRLHFTAFGAALSTLITTQHQRWPRIGVQINPINIYTYSGLHFFP